MERVDVVERDAVAVSVGLGVCAVDGDAVECDKGRVGDGDGLVGVF